MRKTSERFESLKSAALADDSPTKPSSTEARPHRRTPNVLDQRFDVAAAVSGKIKNVRHIWVDPSLVRPWSGHNRDYAALNEQRCADLIDGFRRTGQEFPAIVRKLNDGGEFEFEFICGARRHWTATHLKRDLLIEVRDLDDKQAFLLQDIENRDREDISDYERACDYARALPIHFGGVANVMAKELQIDRSNFAKFLTMAELPVAIVAAYGDVRELVTYHSVLYTKWMKDSGAKRRMMDAAKKLEGQGATGKDVMKALKSAAEGATKKQDTSVSKVRKIGAFSLKQGRGGRYAGSFELSQDASAEDIDSLRQDFEKLVEELTIK